MPSAKLRWCLVVALVIGTSWITIAQTRPTRPKPRATPIPEIRIPDEADKPDEPQNLDTIKTDTDLVTVPVIAAAANGTFTFRI